MKHLVGNTVFVAGAVSGIGLGIATALILAGRKVMLSTVDEAALARSIDGWDRACAGVEGANAGFDQVRSPTSTT